MRVEPISSPVLAGGSSLFVPSFCFSTDAVGDFVYIFGDKVGDNYQVSKADQDVATKMPAVGVIIEKPSATDCVVQLSGIVRGIYTGLTPQKRYFLGADSRPTVAFARPTSGFRVVQVLGLALASGEFLLRFEKPIIVLPV
jgi:hypothetical protein